MVVILRENPNESQLQSLVSWLEAEGLEVRKTEGQYQTILGLVGDTAKIDADLIRSMDIVEDVRRISEPYKSANRKFHPADSVIDCGNGALLGGGHFQIIAGPCSVEGEEQIITVARAVKAAGAGILRGGAFKPRTSPYAFQGLRGEGIRLLLLAKADTGLPIISEIMEVTQLPLFDEVDIIQVGARNMQNFELLKELGHTKKPILLKRGLSSTFQELLMSAEYVMSGGDNNVILCERGIRTFEQYTRNTLDLSAVPALKTLSHLPIVIDPSHAAGIAKMVPPLSLAAAAAGADGLMIEVHNDPAHALSDGPQSLTPEQFSELSAAIARIRPYAYQY
ncbi:MAG: 3-deoxy-7-phosphoheptulonate synthase [Firmicutes bacterium]|nr:3-deoxy-7-phosphoheptulonate synthase [Bacillota bacterium]